MEPEIKIEEKSVATLKVSSSLTKNILLIISCLFFVWAAYFFVISLGTLRALISSSEPGVGLIIPALLGMLLLAIVAVVLGFGLLRRLQIARFFSIIFFFVCSLDLLNILTGDITTSQIIVGLSSLFSLYCLLFVKEIKSEFQKTNIAS